MIDEHDVVRIRMFLDHVAELAKKKAPVALQYSDGMLTTPGCEGNFGCCAESFDLMGHVEDLEELVS